MTATAALITAAAAAWIGQIILGGLQIRRFNQAYTELAKQSAYLGVGRSKGRFTPKSVIIIGLNHEKIITGSLLMEGLTVFSKPKPVEALIGKPYQDINPETLFPEQPRRQQALREALSVNG